MTQVVLKDRVKELSSSTGTGSMTLDGAVQGFQSFAAIGNGNLTFYTISREANWEVGIGMYFTSGPTLERNVVLDSSNGGNLVSWGVGEKEVFVTLPSTVADYVPTPNVFEYLTASLAGTGALGSVIAFSPSVEYLVVAGGGGGGTGSPGAGGGGGAGAGGYQTDTLSISTGVSYTVTIGSGGAANTNGTDSVFSAITSTGGGKGGNNVVGGTGGSGGGGGGTSRLGGPGTAGQGFAGGDANLYIGGGGGGASEVGQAGTGSNRAVGGAGGDGLASTITGASTYYAGGGGGGSNSDGAVANSAGGLGGGGIGSGWPPIDGGTGVVNTGGGGGGSHVTKVGGPGGSGVVILKYADTLTISNPGGGLTFTTSTAVSGYKITTFTAGTGNIQWSL